MWNLMRCLLKVTFYIGLMTFQSIGFAGDSSNPLLNPNTLANPTRNFTPSSCLTELTEVVQPAITTNNATFATMPDFNTVQSGGLLCPGTYNTIASCTVASAGGCGGGDRYGSCGWSANLYGMNNGSLINIATTWYHSGCVETHGNICGGADASDIMYLTPGSFTPPTYSGLYFTAYIESGSITQCTLTATQK